jgi:hypothetical protein
VDASGLGSWTRRRLALVVGGIAASLAGVSGGSTVSAKNKKKKRCRKNGQPCTLSGRKCCKGSSCEEIEVGLGRRDCCKLEGKPCQSPEECCQGLGLTCQGGGTCIVAK